MAEAPKHLDPSDPAFAERRAQARKRLDAIDPAKGGAAAPDPFRRDWFEAVYATADGDPANVPWGNLAPHPLLVDWLAQNPSLHGLRALDVGCGLGDNAAALAGQGAEVIAFDLVPRAADWARRRFPDAGIKFVAADLFDPPPEWRAAFDFVQETYTLQALPAELLPRARQALAAFVRPGGRLLLIARARDDDQAFDGPPWPLARGDITDFATDGLFCETIEAVTPPSGVPHWRALLRKPLA